MQRQQSSFWIIKKHILSKYHFIVFRRCLHAKFDTLNLDNDRNIRYFSRWMDIITGAQVRQASIHGAVRFAFLQLTSIFTYVHYGIQNFSQFSIWLFVILTTIFANKIDVIRCFKILTISLSVDTTKPEKDVNIRSKFTKLPRYATQCNIKVCCALDLAQRTVSSSLNLSQMANARIN